MPIKEERDAPFNGEVGSGLLTVGAKLLSVWAGLGTVWLGRRCCDDLGA